MEHPSDKSGQQASSKVLAASGTLQALPGLCIHWEMVQGNHQAGTALPCLNQSVEIGMMRSFIYALYCLVLFEAKEFESSIIFNPCESM